MYRPITMYQIVCDRCGEVFDGSNIDTDVRFGCLAWGIKPKND